MNKLEAFFDYACPYCLRGHNYLLAVMPKFKNIEVVWRPCEAHPRPEKYGLHSDLCAMGMYYILENNADIMAYHEIMYDAAITKKLDIENLGLISDLVSGLVDKKEFYNAIKSGKYSGLLKVNNETAWGMHNFSAVPSFVLNGRVLVSAEGIGVTEGMLEGFLRTACQ
ncbi:MAG: thioredoxin domain-containing protein [Clostridiales bacterium]|jgi:predicted DsbA family dithiol-disulfide isomerase|nr:thioredoxin domain-containing protein [Clostridiales bacterium]